MTPEEQEQFDNMEAEVFALRAVLAAETPVGLDWGLLKYENRLFDALRPEVLMSTSVLYDALYFDRPDGPGVNIIKVHMYHLRRKLQDQDAPWRVETVQCQGYRKVPVDPSVPVRKASHYTRASSHDSLSVSLN